MTPIDSEDRAPDPVASTTVWEALRLLVRLTEDERYRFTRLRGSCVTRAQLEQIVRRSGRSRDR